MATEPAATPTPKLRRETQTALYARALRTMPGGTDSNFRAWGEDTIYVDRGKGGLVWDIDGNEYIDLRMGYGPVILGHGDERVDDYVNERMRRGVSFSLTVGGRGPGDGARQGADRLGRQGPDDRVRHRGHDARDAHRPRLHRPRQDREVRGPVPRRPRLRADQRLARTTCPTSATRTHPVRLAWGRGIPDAVADTIIPARYNNIDAPAPPVRAPRRGDRRDHRRAGPRQRPGDHAQARLPPGDAGADRGVRDPADLRRGQDRLPLRHGRRGRVLRDHAGPRDLRQGDGQRLPGRRVRRSRGGHERPARTRSATAARTPATGSPPRPRSRRSRSCATRTRSRRSTPPGDASRPACARSSTRPGLPYHFTGHPSMFGIMFTEIEASEYRDWATTDHELYDAIALGMHARGAMPEPDSREPWFFCEAHAQGDIVDRIVSIFSDSLDAALEARAHGEHRSPGPAARWRQRRERLPDERAGRDGPRRQRRPLGRPGGGPPARPRRDARARPASPSWRAGSGSTSRPRRACSPRSRSAASSSRTRRPASTGSGSSSSASPNAPSGRSTCAGSPCPSSSASPA